MRDAATRRFLIQPDFSLVVSSTVVRGVATTFLSQVRQGVGVKGFLQQHFD